MSNRDKIAKYYKRQNRDYTWLIPITALIVVIAIALIQPHFEAKAFNKFTKGHKATYWDAMWTNLRIIAD